jgi:exonuclease SbcC
VKNIRSYESADLGFGSGTTLIAGDVGAGKTSLLYAIEMALFGVAEVNAAYLVRHGAGHAEVSVAFEGGEKRYEISRRFRRLRRKGQETFEAERIRFMVDGAETAYSATELRQQVIDLLGFPDNPSPQAHSDLWRWAVYVPQERMRDILGARPQERLETVRKALGVERYRTAADNAQELASDLRRSAQSRRAEADRLRHFDEEFARGSQLADRLRVDRMAVERTLSDRRASLRTLESARDEAEAQARTAEADERELEGLEREMTADREGLAAQRRAAAEREEEARRRAEERQRTDADADALEPRRSSLADSERELDRAREEDRHGAEVLRALAEARATLVSAEEREADARSGLERLRSEEADARAAHEEALSEGPAKTPPAPTRESLAEIDERLSAARRAEGLSLQEVAQAEASLGEVEELLKGGVCPRCGQSVHPTDYASHRTEAASSARKARERLAKAEADRAKVEEERKARERYERAHERWKEVEKRRSATRAAHERAARAVKAATVELEEAQSAAETTRDRVSGLVPQETRATAGRAEVARLEGIRADRARDVEQSLLSVERRQGIDQALAALNAETERIRQEATALERRITEREERARALRAKLPDMEGLRRSVGEANRRLSGAREQEAEERSLLSRLDAQLDEALRRVRDAEAGRQERSALLAEAKDVEEKAAWVGGAFRTTVLEMEQKLLTHAQALFEREFARYFASLVDDPGLVARTDPAFTPLVMIEGEWTPAEALSGGERTSLALAFRLALAHVVRSMGSLHLDTILLDEPTDGFSPEQVIRMGELLEELALPQVILVSHESQLAAIADRVVRVQKVDGRSVLTTDGFGGKGVGAGPESATPTAPS